MLADETSGTNPKRRRRLRSGAAVVAIFFAVTIAGVWARGLFSGRANSDENYVTTTNPFANIDPNQTSDVSETEGANTTSANATDTDTNIDAQPVPSGWDYTDTFDQVRDATIYHASVDSQNSVDFQPPYEGGSILTMTVRKHPAYGDDVIFKISKGQFVCHSEDCTGTINFGSGPQPLSLSEPDDNSSDTLFAADSNQLIDQLKKSKKVIIELPFYEEGYRQFEFETKKTLVWPPKGSRTDQSADEDEISADD
jgi:hypothetical protein